MCVCVSEREREREREDVLTCGGKKSTNLKNKEFEFDTMVTCCARFKEKIKRSKRVWLGKWVGKFVTCLVILTFGFCFHE